MSGHLPELLLLILALCLLVWDLFLPLRDKQLLYYTALAGLTIVCAAALKQFSAPPDLQNTPEWLGSMVVADGLARGLKVLLSLAGLLAFLTMQDYVRDRIRNAQGEFYALSLFVLLATMLLASAHNLLSIYLSVEFTSLTSYLLAGFLKRNPKSAEAGLKYFLYGAISSGVMLYGMSLLYGLSAATLQQPNVEVLGLNALKMTLALHSGFHTLSLLALLLVLAGIGFKVAIVPFHMWSPDVYEGAPTPFTALLSVAPKAAGFALLLRVVDAAQLAPALPLSTLLAALAAITMTLGNLLAIAQTNLKRMLAYSSIAHAGYLLMAAAVSRSALGADFWLRDTSVAVYLFAYVFMNIGAFAIIIFMSNRFDTEEIADVGLLARASPPAAIAFVIFGLSLAGLPPTLGFIGKYLLISVAIRGGFYWLAIVAILNSAVSIYYYFNVVRLMFFSGAGSASEIDASGVLVHAPTVKMDRTLAFLLTVTVAVTVLFGLYPQPLIDCARSFAGR